MDAPTPIALELERSPPDDALMVCGLREASSCSARSDRAECTENRCSNEAAKMSGPRPPAGQVARTTLALMANVDPSGTSRSAQMARGMMSVHRRRWMAASEADALDSTASMNASRRWPGVCPRMFDIGSLLLDYRLSALPRAAEHGGSVGWNQRRSRVPASRSCMDGGQHVNG
jgi:hypothetical protein